MILVIDVGNTDTVFGVYRGEVLAEQWRLPSDQCRAADACAAQLQASLAARGFGGDQIEGAIICSVVPALVAPLQLACTRCFQKRALVVGPDMDTGIKICYENPQELGPDRIANAVAAFARYRRDLIVVDCGTATTFDCVSAAGEFLGGVIAPGLALSGQALHQRTSRLPAVELVAPQRVVARTTKAAMQAGIILGHAGLVDGIVERIRQETGTDQYVVATGGLARLVADHARTIDTVDPGLTLGGLKIIFDRNRT
jgi:type III pantothenate kinase